MAPQIQSEDQNAATDDQSVASNVSESTGTESKAPFSKREKGLLGGIVAAVVVAIVAIVVAVVSPSGGSAPSGVAADVNGSYIYEEDVAEWIEQYRTAYSLEDDDDFLAALVSEDLNSASFRLDVIDQLALNLLILETAEDLGVMPSDDEVQETIDTLKYSLAFNDDEIWEETLAMYGLSEDYLAEQYKINLAEEAICEAVVEYRDPYDEEIVSYLQSYLADTTQKHAYRIVFETENDAYTECMAELEALEESGELTLDAFVELALEYSTEEDVETTHGSYAWSGGYMSDEAKEALTDVAVGECSEATEVAGDDGEIAYIEIYFCDAAYSFASADEIEEVPDDIPDELMDEIVDATAEVVYQTNCSSYLAWLLATADITYYPMPQDASYNVIEYSTSSSSSDDADTTDSTDADDTDDADTTDSTDADDTDDADTTEDGTSEEEE